MHELHIPRYIEIVNEVDSATVKIEDILCILQL